MRKIIHQIAHILGLYSGHVYSETRGESFYIGFQCGKCGKVDDLHCVDDRIDRKREEETK